MLSHFFFFCHAYAPLAHTARLRGYRQQGRQAAPAADTPLLRVAIGERCFAKTSRPIRPAPPKLFLADERRRDGDHRKHSAGEPRRDGDHRKHSAGERRRAGDHRKHSAGEPRRAGDHRKHSAGEPRQAGDRWKFFARLKRAGAYWLLARVKTNLPKVNSTGKAAYRATVAAPVSRMRLKRKGER